MVDLRSIFNKRTHFKNIDGWDTTAVTDLTQVGRGKDVLTDKDIAHLDRQWILILDPLGRVHFKDKNGVFEYMGGYI